MGLGLGWGWGLGWGSGLGWCLVKVSLFDRATDNEPKHVEVSWEDLAHELTTHDERQPKDGPLWSPCEFAPGATRSKAAALRLHCAVLDLDYLPADLLRPLAEALDGLAYVMHSTHTPGRWRLTLPFKEPLPATMWPATFRALCQALAIPADPTGADASRMYYLPSVAPGDTPLCYQGEGEALDWRTLPDAPTEGPPQAESPPLEAPENFEVSWATGPLDMVALRESLRKVRRPESQALAQRILLPAALAEHGMRDTSVHRAASLVAYLVLLPPATPEAVVELVRPAIQAMPCAPEGVEAWLEKFKGSYRRAIQRRLAEEARVSHLRDKLANTLRGPRDELREAATATNREGPDADAWMQGLVVSSDREGNIKPLPVGANVAVILTNHPEWAGSLAFNELTHNIDIVAPIPVRSDKDLSVPVANWLSHSKFRMHMKSAAVAEQLLEVAKLQRYDPLKEYLHSLQWDGKKRLNTWLQKFLGVHDNALTSAIGRKWAISAVARALRPGCKVDSVLILKGGQGVGKSRVLRALGGAWFSDTKLDVTSKDAHMVAATTWIIEMPELTTMRGRDAETLKGFFSQPDATIRLPYGRVIETIQRRCVFVGSTNEDTFLFDLTGGRRYWPVEVGAKIDVEGVKEIRDQLWAEAVAAFEAGESWWLDDEMEIAAAHHVRDFSEAPLLVNVLAAWHEKRKDRSLVVTAEDVAKDIGYMATEWNVGLAHRIYEALRAIGYERVRKSIGGVQIRAWAWKPALAIRDNHGNTSGAANGVTNKGAEQ